MFYNLKIALRKLSRGGIFSIINIGGLAIGMAATILIMLWVFNQWSYDRFHKKVNYLYEIWSHNEANGYWDKTSQMLGPTLKENYTEFAHVTRYKQSDEITIEREKGEDSDIVFSFQGNQTILVGIADTDFLLMFDFPLLYGNVNTALNDPHSIILTEKIARNIFGNEEPMGQILSINNMIHLTVTGIMADLPENTTFKFNVLIPFDESGDRSWISKFNASTFVELKPDADVKTVNASIRDIVAKHTNGTELTESFLHPVSKLHLYTRFENLKAVGGRIEMLHMFTAVALLILLIACINFMNLSTARSIRHAKEVGVRKVVGARRKTLISHFLGESVLYAAIAVVFAIIIVFVCLPFFNDLVDSHLRLNFANAGLWGAFLILALFTGILAGCYPAFYLSSFLPITVLKGIVKNGHDLMTPRKILIVVQFTVTMILIISTAVIHRQVQYAQKRNVGYDKSLLMYIPLSDRLQSHREVIRNDLLNLNFISSVSYNFAAMTQSESTFTDLQWKSKNLNDKFVFERNYAEADWTKTTGVKILKGRDIDIYTYPSDSMAMLLNESAVKVMGFDDPIGQTIREFGREYHIVGVVEDFILDSPYRPIRPMTIGGSAGWFNHIHIKLNSANNLSENLRSIEQILKKYDPMFSVVPHFTDEVYARNFKQEQRIGTLITVFAVLAVFVSCLGLFGLSAYMAENRRKEIGIRKVLGASTGNIITQISKEFLILVSIAVIIAVPVAWWIMRQWLNGYAYRTNLSWWIFAAVAVFTLVIALFTVSVQSMKAAKTNPVKSIKNE